MCLEELDCGPEYQPFAADLDASPDSFVLSDLADTLWALGRYEERSRGCALLVICV